MAEKGQEEIEFTEVKGESTDGNETGICGECGNNFSITKYAPHKKYCSQSCRNKAKRTKLNGTKKETVEDQTHDNPDIDDDDDDNDYSQHRDTRSNGAGGNRSTTRLNGSLRGLDAQSQYIILHQKESIDKLSTKNDKLHDKLDAAIKERDDLRRTLDKLELEKSFDVAGKSGLNGLSQNPVLLKLVEHAAPALGMWLEQVITKPAASQLTGLESLTPEVQKQVTMISAWYGQLPLEVQKEVFEIIDAFADQEDPEKDPDRLKLKNLLKRVKTISKNGTATNGHQHAAFFPN